MWQRNGGAFKGMHTSCIIGAVHYVYGIGYVTDVCAKRRVTLVT